MAAQTLTLSAWNARRLPDEDVFDRTLRGDPVAFSEVYRRYQKRIYGYCLARSLDPGTAADATQEVFMKLLRAEPGSIENPRAWLFTVARNVAIDVIRKRSRTPEDSGIEEESLAWDRLKSADTADEVLARSDARNVFLALRTIRPRYRTALIMREIHGQSAKDMAEALETSPGAVDTLVSRARDAFGVAYAAVSDLPSACRANVELVYRNLGTGITPQEHAALDAHIGSCERCRAEAKRAENPKHLAALLPFLVPAKGLAHGLLKRAALTARTFPDVALQHGAVVLTQPHTWNLATKIAAGVLAAALVTAPIVATTVKHPNAPKASGSVPAVMPRSSSSGVTALGGSRFSTSMSGWSGTGWSGSTISGSWLGGSGTSSKTSLMSKSLQPSDSVSGGGSMGPRLSSSIMISLGGSGSSSSGIGSLPSRGTSSTGAPLSMGGTSLMGSGSVGR
jgi:RNA polymerase sigma-70 factor (ECF subfamily)